MTIEAPTTKQKASTLSQLVAFLQPYRELRAIPCQVSHDDNEEWFVSLQETDAGMVGFLLEEGISDVEQKTGAQAILTVKQLLQAVRYYPPDSRLWFQTTSFPVPYEYQEDFDAWVHVMTCRDKAVVMVVTHPDVWTYRGPRVA